VPEVLSGEQPGLTVGEIQQQMADMFGHPSNSARYRNMVGRWINLIALDIQLKDPHNRRFTVHQAPITLISGTAEYDVRRSTDDGGWGWDNCYEILTLVLPDLSPVPLEPIWLDQWRQRAIRVDTTGPSVSAVMLDQFRVRIDPTPDQAYTGHGDYRQNVPRITDSGAYIDWPRAWDVALLEGVTWKALMQDEPGNVAAWRTQKHVYEEAREAIRRHDLTGGQVPVQAVVLRTRRSRRMFHDNSIPR
jgi:hypothetical protein